MDTVTGISVTLVSSIVTLFVLISSPESRATEVILIAGMSAGVIFLMLATLLVFVLIILACAVRKRRRKQSRMEADWVPGQSDCSEDIIFNSLQVTVDEGRISPPYMDDTIYVECRNKESICVNYI